MKPCWIFLCAILSGGCASVSPLKIQQVQFGQSIWSGGQRQAGVLFQDGAQSTPVPGGSLWTFGDTFLGRPAADQSPASSHIKGATGTTIAFLPAGETTADRRVFSFCLPAKPLLHLARWMSYQMMVGRKQLLVSYFNTV